MLAWSVSCNKKQIVFPSEISPRDETRSNFYTDIDHKRHLGEFLLTLFYVQKRLNQIQTDEGSGVSCLTNKDKRNIFLSLFVLDIINLDLFGRQWWIQIKSREVWTLTCSELRGCKCACVISERGAGKLLTAVITALCWSFFLFCFFALFTCGCIIRFECFLLLTCRSLRLLSALFLRRSSPGYLERSTAPNAELLIPDKKMISTTYKQSKLMNCLLHLISLFTYS